MHDFLASIPQYHRLCICKKNLNLKFAFHCVHTQANHTIHTVHVDSKVLSTHAWWKKANHIWIINLNSTKGKFHWLFTHMCCVASAWKPLQYMYNWVSSIWSHMICTHANHMVSLHRLPAEDQTIAKLFMDVSSEVCCHLICYIIACIIWSPQMEQLYTAYCMNHPRAVAILTDNS